MPPKSKTAFPHPAVVHHGEADILASVLADQSDDTAKLVYADWLQEHDDPRGKLLRDSVTAFRAGKKLPFTKKVAKPWLDLVGLTLYGKLLTHDFTAHANNILRLARPAVTFESARAVDLKLMVTASKFGGRPDMPEGVAWPACDGQSLTFLAQFNLNDLTKSVVCRKLPSHGLLSVFSLYNEDGGNDDFDAKGSWRVFYFPEDADFAYVPFPSDLDEGGLPACRLTFAETLTLPEEDSPWRKEIGLGEDVDAWEIYREYIAGYGNGHQLLGYPSIIQGDMLGKKTMRHLLTLGGDENMGWQWGDGGKLYFTMSETDLKAKRFEGVRFEMQCS